MILSVPAYRYGLLFSLFLASAEKPITNGLNVLPLLFCHLYLTVSDDIAGHRIKCFWSFPASVLTGHYGTNISLSARRMNFTLSILKKSAVKKTPPGLAAGVQNPHSKVVSAAEYCVAVLAREHGVNDNLVSASSGTVGSFQQNHAHSGQCGAFYAATQAQRGKRRVLTSGARR